jgi:hypothetical protein
MRNTAASLRARLIAWAKNGEIPFQYASMLYMHQGVLARVAESPFSDSFVLKGGFLLFSMNGHAGRTTRDLDFLGEGIPNDPESLKAVFKTILGTARDDGLLFDAPSIQTEPIAEAAEYQGARITVICTFGTIRNTVSIDIGFGDKLPRGPERIPIRRILGAGEFTVLAYPLASVVAEKFETVLALGSVNSRMKDLFDIACILDRYMILDQDLKEALAATLHQRGTALPEYPDVFSALYETVPKTRAYWEGFLRRAKLEGIELGSVLGTIRRRLGPIYEELRNAR